MASGAVLLTLTVTLALPLTLVTWVVAVTVAVVVAGTVGAVNCPVVETTPMVLVQFTAVVILPLAMAVHWLLCSDWMVVGVQLTVMAVTGFAVSVAVAVLVASWLEMTVMVTCVAVLTGGAVYRPLVSMEPMLAA